MNNLVKPGSSGDPGASLEQQSFDSFWNITDHSEYNHDTTNNEFMDEKYASLHLQAIKSLHNSEEDISTTITAINNDDNNESIPKDNNEKPVPLNISSRSSKKQRTTKPHISQTADQRPDEKIIRRQYKSQLQKQIEEQKRRKEERFSIEKEQDEKIKHQVEEDRQKMMNEQAEEIMRKKAKEEAFQQRQDITAKQIEVARLKAEEDRKKRVQEKRHSSISTNSGSKNTSKSVKNNNNISNDLNESSSTTAAAEQSSQFSQSWMNLSNYSNPHDEIVIKTSTIDFNKLIERNTRQVEESEGEFENDDKDFDLSLPNYSKNISYKFSPKLCNHDDDDYTIDESLLSTVTTPIGHSTPSKTSALSETQSYLKQLKNILRAEEERMRNIINKRAVRSESEESGTDQEDDAELDEEKHNALELETIESELEDEDVEDEAEEGEFVECSCPPNNNNNNNLVNSSESDNES